MQHLEGWVMILIMMTVRSKATMEHDLEVHSADDKG